MKSKVRFVTIWTVPCMIAAAILVGCAARQVSLSGIGAVTVEVIPSRERYVHITDVDVYQDGDDLVVAGTAVKQGPLFNPYRGHVDVAVIMDGQGERVTLGTAEYRHHPSRRRTSSL